MELAAIGTDQPSCSENALTRIALDHDGGAVGGVLRTKVMQAESPMFRDRREARTVHADAIYFHDKRVAVIRVEVAAARKDDALAIRRKACSHLRNAGFGEQQMLITAVGIHYPELAVEVRKRKLSEDDELPVGRPGFPRGGIVWPQIRELPDVAAVGVHRVDVRPKDESDPSILAGEGGTRRDRRQHESRSNNWDDQEISCGEFHSTSL